MSKPSEERAAILLLLRAGYGIDMLADLSVFPEATRFVVSYLPQDEEIQGLTQEQQQMLRDEGELTEYFDSPGPAVALFLRIQRGREKVQHATPPIS